MFVNDCPLKPQNSNIYVDDTLAWNSHKSKKKLTEKLQRSARKMYKWCRKNRIQINYDKVKLIFNEQSNTESITIEGHKIEATKETLKYLGAEFKANTVENHSAITIDLTKTSQDIIKRCQYMKSLRKYKIPQRWFTKLCIAFIGGKLNYYTPWLAAEVHPGNQIILHKLEKAYNEYMRTISGAFKSTPIPVLHAITRLPRLRDKIKADASIAMVNAVANNALMGEEYTKWENEGAGWTPYGTIRETLRRVTPRQYDEAVHPLIELPPETLEGLSRCHFHLSNKQEAIKRHEEGKLLPKLQPGDIEMYTDGSLYKREE